MSGGSLFNSFDDAEFGNAPVDNSAIEIVQNSSEDLGDPIEDVIEGYDAEMDEAEQKINLAGYYRVLVKGGLFKNDSSDAAKIVDAEVRAFAKGRMAALLNLASTKVEEKKVELPFTEVQISVLQHLANLYHEKQKQAPQSQPMVRPLAPPTPPQAPQAVRPTIPQVTPLASPTPARETPAKPQERKRQPAAQKPPKGKVDYSLIADNTPFEENGKLYKLVTNPETRERVKLKVHQDKKVQSPHRLPMPSAHAMASMSIEQSHQALSTTERVVEQTTRSVLKR